ncbi:hypothetical protein KC19_6G166600 [Ceratodon purpureus]|uniref:Uncharacterized protein n=1 Tax=Ceratodon purpureus TaxID=3225 RepID=A0A8T0HH87_CERPU|nr:hypothetical protein KC19_6G166600 [Ceratodon purpureus]
MFCCEDLRIEPRSDERSGFISASFFGTRLTDSMVLAFLTWLWYGEEIETVGLPSFQVAYFFDDSIIQVRNLEGRAKCEVLLDSDNPSVATLGPSVPSSESLNCFKVGCKQRWLEVTGLCMIDHSPLPGFGFVLELCGAREVSAWRIIIHSLRFPSDFRCSPTHAEKWGRESEGVHHDLQAHHRHGTRSRAESSKRFSSVEFQLK